MKYVDLQDNEWVCPARTGYKLACCDCSLVHNIDFQIRKIGGGRTVLSFRASRNNRATSAMRRGMTRVSFGSK